MAENYNDQTGAPVESTDRGLFGFGKKKDDEVHKTVQHEGFANEFEDKVQISEPVEHKHGVVEEEKHHDTLLDKFHQADDHPHNSSSSSSDEEDSEEKKQRKREKKEKKGLKEKVFEKLPGHDNINAVDTTVPISKPPVEEAVYSDKSRIETPHLEEDVEKKGFLSKIKDKLTGEKKVEEHHDVVPPVVAEPRVGVEGEEKKGFMEKIKEKIPGHGAKDGEVKKDHE